MENLPNIVGGNARIVQGSGVAGINPSGAFQSTAQGKNAAASSTVIPLITNFDASRCSTIYSSLNKVYTMSLTILYYIKY